MRAGKLDRWVTIQQASTVIEAAGDETLTWSTFVEVWGGIVYKPGNEQSVQGIEAPSRPITFRIRYVSGVTGAMRLNIEGVIYNILDVREVGRRAGLDIEAIAQGQDEAGH